MSGIGKIQYIKISRTDGNGIDITNSLEALESIVMPLSTGNKSFSILNRTKEQEYFLFYVSMAGTEDIPAIDKSSPEYIFTGSMDNGIFYYPGGVSSPIDIPISSSITDNLNFFDPTSGTYVIGTLNAKTLNYRLSGSIDVTNFTNQSRINIFLNGSLLKQSSFISSGANQAVDIEGVIDIDSTPGAAISVKFSDFFGAATASFDTGAKFFISSSNAVVNPKDMSVEPYFTSLYYGTDCDVMYGDVSQGVSNPFFQDVDYSVGIITPTNYIALRDNTATKAVVPQSMFTINSLINPGYGSKNQSEEINEWTISKNNIGTYGKTSPVDSLKSLVVYCDWIGGNTPEKHNSQTAHIQYIINEDGRINEPNLLDTSIGNVQQAFESNQNLIVNLTDPPVGQGMEILNGLNNIDRGGYRIEPILYTQSGSLYTGDGNVYFTGSKLVGNTLDASTIDDYYFLAYLSADISYSAGSTTKVDLDDEISDVNSVYNPSNNRFTITQEMINDGVDITLIFNARIVATSASFPLVMIALIKNGDISTPVVDTFASPTLNSLGISTSGGVGSVFNLTYTIPASSLLVGDYYEVFVSDILSLGGFKILRGNDTDTWGFTSFSTTQSPAPSGGTLSVGTDTIWGYPSSTDFSIITGSQAGINNSYGFYKQEDIPNSGFKTISETWSLKPGDEFRFEDREDRVFMVQSVVPPSSHPSGTLEVQLDKPIPTASINLDHFLIRRYVPDGSIILFDGSKPAGSSGPSLIKPQYVTQTLTKGVDEYILDLTNKGLIN